MRNDCVAKSKCHQRKPLLLWYVIWHTIMILPVKYNSRISHSTTENSSGKTFYTPRCVRHGNDTPKWKHSNGTHRKWKSSPILANAFTMRTMLDKHTLCTVTHFNIAQFLSLSPLSVCVSVSRSLFDSNSQHTHQFLMNTKYIWVTLPNILTIDI